MNGIPTEVEIKIPLISMVSTDPAKGRTRRAGKRRINRFSMGGLNPENSLFFMNIFGKTV